ncbi:hypothetical protein GCM10029992_39970 [Glycomyces albus]
MITATGLELRAGSRILLSGADLRVQAGDRIGLVGRNGAGKTTTMNVLAGLNQPYTGSVESTGPFGYLPQDPRFADLSQTASNRVLSARGLDRLLSDMAKAEAELAEVADDAKRDKVVRRYSRLEEQFAARGGYAAESEAARICSNLGLEDRVLAQTLETLSGGQRRRVELARILFADDGDGVLLLDEPTNHLDADSVAWLRASSPATRAAWCSSPTTSNCSTRSSTRSGSSTPPAARSTSTTSAGRPTSASAPRTPSAAAASGPTPRRRPPASPARPPSWARRPRRPRPRRVCCAAPNPCSTTSKRTCWRRRSPMCACPIRPSAARSR